MLLRNSTYLCITRSPTQPSPHVGNLASEGKLICACAVVTIVTARGATPTIGSPEDTWTGHVEAVDPLETSSLAIQNHFVETQHDE